MAVEPVALVTGQSGQTKVCDLQVTRGADEEVGWLKVLLTHAHAREEQSSGCRIISGSSNNHITNESLNENFRFKHSRWNSSDGS